MSKGGTRKSIFGIGWKLLRLTAVKWLNDNAPRLGAALAYYTVFSIAPLVLILLAIIGVVFRNDPAGAWSKLTEQMGYLLDKSTIQVIQDIARTAAAPAKSTARHDYRDRFCLIWRKRGIRPVAGCVKHDLGRESQTNKRYLEVFARSFSVVCDGWGSLFSVACVARDRGAESV